MINNGSGEYFNRHLLKAGLECPVKLFYKANHFPEDVAIQPFLEHAGFNKHHLKLLAGSNYPQAIRIQKKTKQEAAEKTGQLLGSNQTILKEAAFIYQHYYAKVPILCKKGDAVKIIDIQTKSVNSGKHHFIDQHGRLLAKWRAYLVDLAYKQFVMHQLYPAWTFEMQLWLPDKRKQTHQDDLLQALANNEDVTGEDLFYKVDVTDLVKSFRSWRFSAYRKFDLSFDETVASLCDQYINPRRKQPPIGKKCARCEFRIRPKQIERGQSSGFEQCWRRSEKVSYSEDEPLVLDLIGPGVKHWLKQGIYLQKDIPDGLENSWQSLKQSDRAITQKQRQGLQIRKAKGKEVPREIAMPSLFKKMADWTYPLHFLDFEAGNYAVPIRAGREPYHPVLFQFSCHTLGENGQCKHHQWIAESTATYPNYELIRQLMGIPNIQQGTIVHYSNFEKYGLKRIRKEVKAEQAKVADARKLMVWLDEMLGSTRHASLVQWADLSRLVLFYYNRFMDDSLSVKSLAQSVLSVSDVLKQRYSLPYSSRNFDDIVWWQWNKKKKCAQNPYHILRHQQGDVEVGRGTEAMSLFGKMIAGKLSKKHFEQAKRAMLKYCELDTLAMVMMVEHWQHLKKEKL